MSNNNVIVLLIIFAYKMKDNGQIIIKKLYNPGMDYCDISISINESYFISTRYNPNGTYTNVLYSEKQITKPPLRISFPDEKTLKPNEFFSILKEKIKMYQKSKIIEKKIWSEYYDDVLKGVKTCELRKDDSNYCVGDVLILREWNGTEYTGRNVSVKITYILRNLPEFGLKNGYAIICFRRLNESGKL